MILPIFAAFVPQAAFARDKAGANLSIGATVIRPAEIQLSAQGEFEGSLEGAYITFQSGPLVRSLKVDAPHSPASTADQLFVTVQY